MKKINLYCLIAFLFISIIIIMTYPLAFKIKAYIPGFFSTDEPYGVLWTAWLIKFSLLNNLTLAKTNFIAYPFGVVFYGNNFIGYLFFAIIFILSALTNPVLTYNLQILGNFFLTALFMYLLVYRITETALTGFFSGVILGFCPYIFVRSWQHLGETYLWPIPLFLWSAFRLKDKDRLQTRIIFIISFILITINFNTTYYTLIIFLLFLIYITVCNFKKNKDYIKKIILLSFIAFIFLIPQFFLIFKNLLFSKQTMASAQNIFHRPFEDLFTQSAKPLSYFLPAIVHPIFGKFTEQFIGSQLYGISFTEHTLYLGWIPLILAFVAFRGWRKFRQPSVLRRQPSMDNDNFYIGFFLLLAIVAWFFSQPPWWNIFGFKIYMPSFFMYKILPMFRAYCRFGFIVMFAIAVLAGFGLKFILERFNSEKKKITITILLCMLVLFEFWNYPPFKVIDISRAPAVYYWIKEQPQEFVIAEYPLDIVGPSELYKLYQITHQKKIINATLPGTFAHRISKTITKLSDTHTASKLKWMGVKYVLVHKQDYLKTELVEDREELNKIPGNSGLKFLKSFPAASCPDNDIACVQDVGPVDVYEVVVLPIKPELQEK